MFNTNLLSRSNLGTSGIILVTILSIIVAILKGLALWNAAKRHEKWWFVVMLILNTVGILEWVYLVFVAKVRFDQLFKK